MVFIGTGWKKRVSMLESSAFKGIAILLESLDIMASTLEESSNEDLSGKQSTSNAYALNAYRSSDKLSVTRLRRLSSVSLDGSVEGAVAGSISKVESAAAVTGSSSCTLSSSFV